MMELRPRPAAIARGTLTQRLRRSASHPWFWFVLIGTVLGALIAAGVAIVAPSSYTARVTILVSPTPTEGRITNSDVQVAEAYIPTLAELATVRPILDRVIAATGIEMDTKALAEVVSTHVPAATSLLTISVSNRDAASAAAVANAIASELKSYAPAGGPDLSNGLQLALTIVDPATAPTVRDGPGLPVRIGLGGAIALFLTLSIVFLVENVGRGAQSVGRAVEGLNERPERLRRSPSGEQDPGATIAPLVRRDPL
jgi:capsular polysaccharide biosynthesis protein